MEGMMESQCKSNDMSLSIFSMPENLRICLVGDVVEDEGTVAAANRLGVTVVASETGLEHIDDSDWKTMFIVSNFEGPVYEAIHKSKQSIMGPPAFMQTVEKKEKLKLNSRPIYNYSMRGVVTCFTGIRKKDELTKLVNLIHSMGGCIRKDMNSKITHLISTHSGGDKYRYAKTFRLTVVRPAWVYAAWLKRNDPDFNATTEEFSKEHKLQPFEGQKICFFGFPTDEHQHMVDVLISNGGASADIDDPECSHVVVDEHSTQVKPDLKSNRTHILKSDWFWYSIQNGYADESDYLFCNYLDSLANTPTTELRESLPLGLNKRKRKRFSQRLQIEGSGTPIGSGKRRSSISDAGLLSVSGSFLDCTMTPEKGDCSAVKLLNEPDLLPFDEQTPIKSKSMRYNHFVDFYSTESNYVGILETILNFFKIPLEQMLETPDAILNKSEIKAIFGNFLPIHDVHQRMLERLRMLQSQWQEDCLIGDIIIENSDELIRAYPPYVNFFEKMKEALVHCDTQQPRFHAFLKINQAKPECGRQTLQDLMIRPVQRLPSISLLLNDILKHTNKNNADYGRLEEALKTIKEVMMHINEDKRKTESRMAIFDIFNEIEGCPPHLVSSNRSLIFKCEVTELSDNLSGRGDPLLLILFSDTIEVCKRRSRSFNTVKSPSNNKPYKHIKLMSLKAIRFVIDITDSLTAFALLCRHDKDKINSFTITDDVDKVVYLKTICKQMAENACRTDTDKALLYRTSQELEINLNDINMSTLSKAFKLAARTRLKVGRAFSFNKTPSKIKRAMSSIMTTSFGSNGTLTPASQLAQMRLASCSNIHEVGDEQTTTGDSSPSLQLEALSAPLSVQSTRKNINSATLNALGRLQ